MTRGQRWIGGPGEHYSKGEGRWIKTGGDIRGRGSQGWPCPLTIPPLICYGDKSILEGKGKNSKYKVYYYDRKKVYMNYRWGLYIIYIWVSPT